MSKDPIKQIIRRLNRLGKAVFAANSQTGKVEKRGRSARESLPVHILRLRSDSFFKQPMTAKETHARLQSHYACDLNRVSMALLRLQNRKQLRKTSKRSGNKKEVAYVC